MVALVPGLSWAQECTTDARRVVDAIYRQVLERNANAEGATAVTQLSTGQTTVRELVRNIAKSQEHVRRFMSGARSDDVTYAYRHLLGREPDQGGLAAQRIAVRRDRHRIGECSRPRRRRRSATRGYVGPIGVGVPSVDDV